MFEEIPQQRPQTTLLDNIDSPADLRELDSSKLEELAQELRAYLLYCVGKTGGHFGAGLGVVELTIALHYVFNTPEDRLVWDVGHQSYPHKILTGRRERMLSIRQKDGLAAFNNRQESEYDTFGVGHSSTSISAALGMMMAARKSESERKVVAIIGDGAMTAGMAFEALNHAGELDDDILVILNDNNMSISKNVGGLSSYFARMWASKPYNFLRSGSKKVLSKVPPAWKAAHRAEEYMKGMVSPATIFEELGFNYFGLIDGHDVGGLVDILNNIKNLRGPLLLHIVTQKGKGYLPAEEDPYGMHALNKLASADELKQEQQQEKNTAPTYSKIFGQWLCEMASVDPKLMAITPAMGEGSGMREFEENFPEQFFDVAIAEQHAVTFAAGMACDGLKPIVAIYSTFLQRAYDQLIHDVALQNLDILFAIDRAGLVGEDGPTHAGSFDLSYLRCIPNLIVMAPSDENEARHMLYTGYHFPGPAAVRYPRGKATGCAQDADLKQLDIGKAVVKKQGEKVAILVFGTLLQVANNSAEELNATLVDMRFVKPIDETLLEKLAKTHQLLVTVEENVIKGGAGSAVNEFLATLESEVEGSKAQVINLGLPDEFLDHGKAELMLAECGLDSAGITAAIVKKLPELLS
ncbi:1-deoxy-D-xylulose-5-phosphate synthase [Haliea sp. AH-315-K21]|uniref:1-deoxy-D-xylulose-5-phosphate synthase n=1 Tax=SAR86 cluster bacterium TaxID=2030880 RepID=A0A2A5CK91_9GAMM|nr:1-deoxy-D-xylulose-5-phosphate synthase [Haliea sp. AH-315-K21]PCJ41836.1 MAG: 1-deoxy-D-xylulose-5-phosphate synthase [SAR86 cluster bacterium]PCJ43786.1 MAG: 1-deoxy-D-xylulose-5-phosphate synthase [SAR86 cluster bacterium]